MYHPHRAVVDTQRVPPGAVRRGGDRMLTWRPVSGSVAGGHFHGYISPPHATCGPSHGRKCTPLQRLASSHACSSLQLSVGGLTFVSLWRLPEANGHFYSWRTNLGPRLVPGSLPHSLPDFCPAEHCPRLHSPIHSCQQPLCDPPCA